MGSLMPRSLGLWIILATAGSGCLKAPLQPDLPPVTQLQIRAMQSRTYSGQDAKTVLRVVLNVLEDDGFLVHYGSTDLGLLDASKTVGELDVGGFSIPLSVLFPAQGNIPVVDTVQATANVSEFGDRVKVRVNFERKLTRLSGTVIRVAQVTEAKRYQEFFVKLDKGLFLQREGL